jgi:hypothetical protein
LREGKDREGGPGQGKKEMGGKGRRKGRVGGKGRPCQGMDRKVREGKKGERRV